jgi:hypothetical protein
MLFKLSYTISSLDLKGAQFLEMSPPSLGGIKLIFRSPNDEELEQGNKSYNALLDIIIDYQPSRKSIPVFDALFEGRRPKEGEKANTAESMIHHEGSCYGLDFYPNPFIDFIQGVDKKLSSAGKSVTSVLRWRYAQEGKSSPISTRGTSCFNESTQKWIRVPGQYSVLNVTPKSSSLNISQVDSEEIARILDTHDAEPLAHELLREAKELQHKSQRSSVLVAVSSAEVAIKTVVAQRVPDAAWLVEGNQAPPIVDMLINYFPLLFEEKDLFYKPSKNEGIVKTLFDAVHIRNQMVHKGVAPPSNEKVATILTDIEKLIWGCDYLSGHIWAREKAVDNN